MGGFIRWRARRCAIPLLSDIPECTTTLHRLGTAPRGQRGQVRSLCLVGIAHITFNIHGICCCFRILLDRAHADVDSTCQGLNSDMESAPLASPLPSSLLHGPNTSTSETNTSDPTTCSHHSSLLSTRSPSSKTPLDLSQILLNIKSCRWRHFRPRTISHHPLGEGGLSLRGFRDFSRTMSGLTRTLSGGTNTLNRIGPAPTPVHGESAVFLPLWYVFFFSMKISFVLLGQIFLHHTCRFGPENPYPQRFGLSTYFIAEIKLFAPF